METIKMFLNEALNYNTIASNLFQRPSVHSFKLHASNKDIQPGTNKEKQPYLDSVLDEGQGFWEQTFIAVTKTLEVWVNKTTTKKQYNIVILVTIQIQYIGGTNFQGIENFFNNLIQSTNY